MKKILFLLPLLVLPLLLSTCSRILMPVEGEPYTIGTIIDIDRERNSILVDEPAGEESRYDDRGIWLSISDDTPIFSRNDSGSLERADAGDLSIGMRVEAWVSGVIFTSDPAVGGADQIIYMRP